MRLRESVLRKILFSVGLACVIFGVWSLVSAARSHADPVCYGWTCDYQQPWNGQQMPTWDVPPYGGDTPSICDPYSLSCRGAVPGR